jgi:hypothetical protein
MRSAVGGDESVADVEPRHHLVGRLRIETLEAARHHSHTEVQARQQHVEQAARPGPVRRGPRQITRLGEEFMRKLHARQMTEQHAMRVERTLGLPRRARRVDHHRRIIRRRGDGFECPCASLEKLFEAERKPVRAIG